MPYLGTQPNNVKQNTGLYTPSEILELTKDGSWGGSLELIQEQTFSGAVSSIQFTDIKESVYDVHLMVLSNVQCDTDGASTKFYYFEDGVGYETSTDYDWVRQIQTTAGGSTEQRTVGLAGLTLFGTTDNDTNEKNNGYVYFYNLGNASKYSFNNFQTAGINFYETGMNFGGGVLKQASKVTGIKFDVSSGNFSSFTIKLYGVKQI